MLFFHDELVGGLQGPAGPDGNPIGTVISYMGKAAPKDYLVCDGAIYQIVDYPDLATFFETQFGTKNHFGGDGTATFAVPDLRNLFLRGYHGEAEEQLSGEVGMKQEGTEFPHYRTWASGYWGNYGGENKNSIPNNFDKTIGSGEARFINSEGIQKDEILYSSYTARPVNTAVLYCIKAVESIGYDANDYSLDEKRIGTWIDGKPIYRRCFNFTTPSTVNDEYGMDWKDVGIQIENIGVLVNSLFVIVTSDNYATVNVPVKALAVHNERLECGINLYDTLVSCPAVAVLEYTKTTD